jgi:hypothetical protein
MPSCIKTTPSGVRQDGAIDKVKFILYFLYLEAVMSQKQKKAIPETMLMSETSLAKDWNTTEEDKAWANL